MQLIKNLLIQEHGKFFNKAYYKLSEPFIGKPIDVKNKQALALMCQGKYEEAEDKWKEAIELNPNHFDTIVNMNMFLWKIAEIDDKTL